MALHTFKLISIGFLAAGNLMRTVCLMGIRYGECAEQHSVWIPAGFSRNQFQVTHAHNVWCVILLKQTIPAKDLRISRMSREVSDLLVILTNFNIIRSHTITETPPACTTPWLQASLTTMLLIQTQLVLGEVRIPRPTTFVPFLHNGSFIPHVYKRACFSNLGLWPVWYFWPKREFCYPDL